MTARRLIFLVTEDKYFYSHRLPMVRAAQQAGFDVSVITNVANHQALIEAAGVRVIPLSLDRRSLNPFKALFHICRIAAIYHREKPDLVHHIAMKPVLLGSIAAWLTGIPRVLNAFAGLGYVFTARDCLVKILRPLLLGAFRVLLKRPGSYLLLQNDDDLALLENCHVAPPGRSMVIRGSGIDLNAYKAQSFPSPSPNFICIFAGRMIGIKGLETLREAFVVLATQAPHIKLWLCGAPDPANPASWTNDDLNKWAAASGNVIYKGNCADMAAIWAQAHVAVQPSWGGEGVPKSLLEAAASARAIVATDVPGCRDMVRPGDNGWLVPPRDAPALAAALLKMAADISRCRAMGEASRRLVEQNGFSAEAVTAETEALYRRLCD